MKVITVSNIQPVENEFVVFLAGSMSTNWRGRVIERLQDSFGENEKLVVVDPTNNDWEKLGKEDVKNEKFTNQLAFEFANLSDAGLVFFRFEDGALSPISLFEFGLSIHKPITPIVSCAPEYPKAGHIQTYCFFEDIPTYDDLEDAIDAMIEFLLFKLEEI